MFSKRSVVVVALAAVVAACGGGGSPAPTAPSTGPAQPAATVSSVAVAGLSGDTSPGQSAQLTATATLSNGTAQVVTAQAAWQSSNTSVATVASGGMVTTAGAGQAEIRATYQNVTGNLGVTVVRPAAPAATLSGTVREDGNGAVIGGATVIVKDTRFSATTDGAGRYSMSGVGNGNYVLRATKSGYQITERSVTVNSGAVADISMRKASSPSPSPTPNPTPAPPPTSGTCSPSSIPRNADCIGNGSPPVTAVCNDGAFSCSQNRQGTCSSHGGVRCWVCPGALCNGLTPPEATSSRPYTPAPLFAGQ